MKKIWYQTSFLSVLEESLFQPQTRQKNTLKTQSSESKSSRRRLSKQKKLLPVALPTRVQRPVSSSDTLVAVSARGIPVGESSASAKYTDYEVDCVFAYRDAGWSYAQIAQHLDMPKSTVYAICTGKIRSTIVDRFKVKK